MEIANKIRQTSKHFVSWIPREREIKAINSTFNFCRKKNLKKSKKHSVKSMPSAKVILMLSAVVLAIYFVDNSVGSPYPSIGNPKGKTKRLGNCAFFSLIIFRVSEKWKLSSRLFCWGKLRAMKQFECFWCCSVVLCCRFCGNFNLFLEVWRGKRGFSNEIVESVVWNRSKENSLNSLTVWQTIDLISRIWL
jgi:hypothetical protein